MKKRTTAFEKRIKRQVTSRKQRFFVSVTPGLTKLCFNELKSIGLSSNEISITSGGVEFSGFLHDCYRANLHLRTASRILMRITDFKASNFRTLDKKISNIPWELYLKPEVSLQISVSCKTSRLYHSGGISEHVENGIYKRLSAIFKETRIGFDEKKSQLLFVRIINDRVTFSFDSSGENLHKRNIKTNWSASPLRETLACAALKFSGYTKDIPLIDPMCGTGTFSLESALIASNIPPGLYRSFSFMNWPCFRQTRYKQILREAQKEIILSKTPSIFASDKDIKSTSAFSETLKGYDFSELINIHTRDFFEFLPEKLTNQKGLVVFNPPYGLRLGSVKESEKTFFSIMDKLGKDYKGWRFGIIVPQIKLIRKVPFKASSHPFSHGGLELYYLTGRV